MSTAAPEWPPEMTLDLSLPRTPRARALRALSDPAAPRVFSPGTLRAWLAGQDVPISRPSLQEALDEWTSLALVDRVRRGTYLNLRAYPTPTLAEAAPHIRAGAVISLQFVLGQAGVLNNPTAIVTAVVPLDTHVFNAVGTVKAEGDREFQFYGMRARFVPAFAGAFAEDAYQPYAPTLTATPEKALLDWLYLAKTSPNWRAPPAHDLDFDLLDADRLTRLATRMDLLEPLARLQGKGLAAEQALQHAGPRRPRPSPR
jgi:hypothetical protein